MTPAEFTIPFYQGVTWAFTFRIVEEASGDPVNLTGTGPFSMVIQKTGTREVIAEVEGTGDYDDTGIVSFTVPAETTESFLLGKVMVGIRDNDDTPLMQGIVPVFPFPTA